MPYWQLFYHIITTTKERVPLLIPEVEQEIFGYIKSKVYQLEGDLYAVNGTSDHIHLVVTIPPKFALAEFVGQLKGFSSALYSKTHPEKVPFAWQTEYGAFSFDKKRLPNYIDYVEKQKEHHNQGTCIPILERCNEQDICISEMIADYHVPFDADETPPSF